MSLTTPPVPYIVRVERGTINRGIYDIAVLFDPTKPLDRARAAGAVERQGGLHASAPRTGQPRLQFRTEQNWADDNGAVARLHGRRQQPDRLALQLEPRPGRPRPLMMMKEHIVDSYGEIKYTMGNGCSGGSIQQNTVASIFPGLLDGIQPSCDYPDSITTGIEVTDCVLLVNFYAGTGVDRR